MRSLKNKPQVNAPSSTYPYGQIKDDDGSGNVGTPVNEQVYGDFHQFFSQLMKDGNLIANELPENEYNGFQLNTALALFIKALAATVPTVLYKKIDIGDWNMNSTASVNVNHGLNPSKIVGVEVTIIPDSGLGFPNESLIYTSDSSDLTGGQWFYDPAGTTIQLTRYAAGHFANTNYDQTSWNRGYIVIAYLP